MRTHGWISLLWSLGLVIPACYADRPVYVAVTPSSPGTAGTTGGLPGAGGDDSGESGTTGWGGMTGVVAGTTGEAGTGGTETSGCAQMGQIVENKGCALAGACHDRDGAAASFSLAGLPFTDVQGWRSRLVGKYSKGGGVIASMCGASGRPYLVSGSVPATGLLLDKLKNSRPPCGDAMPSIGERLTATELDCVQRWANKLTSTAPLPCVDTACPGECVGTCSGEWFCDLAPVCSGVATQFCGCDGKTFSGDTCAHKAYAHKGPCETAATCPITCGAGEYCRYTYGSSPDGGAGTSGVFACWPVPISCNGIASCACLEKLGCYSCQQESDHVRCAGGV